MTTDRDDLTDEDPDTNLILDYLSNRLPQTDVVRLEERVKRDKAFRYKLAEIVLLKGLVVMDLDRDSPESQRECRQIRTMFPAYVHGKTGPQKTAQLSRHLEDCFDCDTEFERLRGFPGAIEGTRPWWSRFRRILSSLMRWRPRRTRARS